MFSLCKFSICFLQRSVIFPFLCFFLASFTVMCYNVLCDKYATRQLYGYCPSWALNWEYRKKGIMEEIVNCDADIISLQVTGKLFFIRNRKWTENEYLLGTEVSISKIISQENKGTGMSKINTDCHWYMYTVIMKNSLSAFRAVKYFCL